jgi:hypothetical protein
MTGPHTQAYPPANHYPQAYYQQPQQPQQPPPFPDNIRDPIAFHHMFNEQLATLTFNSKAIIQHLGYISKLYANSPMAPVIAESIERQINKVSCKFATDLIALFSNFVPRGGRTFT